MIPDVVHPDPRRYRRGARQLALWLVACGGLASAVPAFALQAPDAGRAAAVAQGLSLTPQMFGAAGDGRSDDTAAVAAWLGSGRPLFCAGRFRLTRRLSVTLPRKGGLFLQGAGRQLCSLILAAPEASLSVAGGTPDIYDTPEVVIHDVGLVPAAVLTHPALSVAFTGGSGATDPTLDLRDLAVKPAAPGFYAPACLSLDNARNGVVEAVNCEGRRGRYVAGTRGVVVGGNAQPVEVTLRDINTYYVDEGIALGGTWQGVSINEATCVACRVGVEAEASDNNGVWLRVLDSHFNVEDFGVEAVNIASINVRGTFTYLNAVGASRAPYHACVSLRMLSQATMWAKIDDTSCDGTQLHGAETYGVFLDSARPPGSFLMESRIDGNSFYDLDWGVFLKNAAAVAVGRNTYAVMRKGEIWNGSTVSGPFTNTVAPKAEPLRAGAN